MRLLTLLAVCSMGLLGAGESTAELPEFDPILAAAGRPIRWEQGPDGRVRFHPAPRGDKDGLPFLVLPGDAGNRLPFDALLGGGPQAAIGLLLSGGQDFASLGDAATHAKRLGWDISEAALRARVGDATAVPLDRLLAFRLLEKQYPTAATALRSVLAKEQDVHLRHAAHSGPATGLDDLAQLLPTSAIVRIVYRPSLYPAQGGGIAAGRYFGVLGVLRTVDHDRQSPIDVDLLSLMAYDTDAAGELPIAFAARFGNVRIDRVVAWMTPSKDGALWEAQVRGAGGAAAGRAFDTWLGPSRPVSEGRRWQTDSWWSEVIGEDLMRWGIGAGTPPAPAGASPKWDQPNPRSALCISAGAAALADAAHILGIYWVDQDGKRSYPPVPPAVVDLLHGDQTASVDVWFDGKDTLWEVRAPGVDELRVLALRDWLEDWLPTMPQATKLLTRQLDGHLARVEHRGTETVLSYRTQGAPLRDGYRNPAAVINIMMPDWPELLGRIKARVQAAHAAVPSAVTPAVPVIAAEVPRQRSIYSGFPVGAWWDSSDNWPQPGRTGDRTNRFLSIVARNQADGGIAICNWQRAGEEWQVRGHRAQAGATAAVTRLTWVPRDGGQRIIADRKGIAAIDPDPVWRRVESVAEQVTLAGRTLVAERNTWRTDVADGTWKELTIWHADGVWDCRQGMRYGHYDLEVLLPADAVQARFRMGRDDVVTWTTLGGVTSFGVADSGVPGIPASACVGWHERDSSPDGVCISERVLWPGVPGGLVSEERTSEADHALVRRFRLHAFGIPAAATQPPGGRIAVGVWTGCAVGDWVRCRKTDATGAVTADETRRVLGVDRMGSPQLAVIDHVHGDRTDEEIVPQLAPILGPGQTHVLAEETVRNIPFGNRATEAVRLRSFNLTDEWNRPGHLTLGEMTTWNLPWRSFGGGTGGENLLGPTVVSALSDYNGGQYDRHVVVLDEPVVIAGHQVACVREVERYHAGRMERTSEILTSLDVPGGIVMEEVTGTDWKGNVYRTRTEVVGFGRATAP